jgi:hypothetical protein
MPTITLEEPVAGGVRVHGLDDASNGFVFYVHGHAHGVSVPIAKVNSILAAQAASEAVATAQDDADDALAEEILGNPSEVNKLAAVLRSGKANPLLRQYLMPLLVSLRESGDI